MANEFKLSYTAKEIDDKLGEIDNVVKITAQTLTDEQKAQARANIGAAAVGEAGDGGGAAQIDWADITNKPVITEGGDTLTWDGNTEGLVNLDSMFYKVSDVVPTLDDLVNGCTATANGIQYPCSAIQDGDLIYVSAEDGSPVAMLVPFDNAYDSSGSEDTKVTEKGIYFFHYSVSGISVFVSSLTINGYTGFTTEKIAPSHLYQPDWNQTDETAPDFIKNRTHWAKEPVTTTEVIFPEGTYTFSEGSYDIEYPLFIENNEECVVTWDGVEYTVIASKTIVEGMEYIVFGNPAILGLEENPEDNGMPFAGTYSSTQALTLFMSSDSVATEHSISIIKNIITQEVHKLDNKYIDAEWMPKKTMLSTVGLVETTTTIPQEGYEIPRELVNTDVLMKSEYYDVIWNGETYRCSHKEFAGYTFIGNLCLFAPDLNDSGEPFVFITFMGMFIVVVPEETEATFSITCYNSVADSTMPIEFLPEQLQFGYDYEAEIVKDAITWDGDTTERVKWETFYHVSSAVPTIEELYNGCVIATTNGSEFGELNIDSSGIRDDGLVIMIGEFACIFREGAEAYGFPAGTYLRKQNESYVYSFKINNCQFIETETKFKTIDAKYLPDDIGGGSGLPEVTTDDNGKTLCVVDGEWHIKQQSYSYNDLTNKPIPEASVAHEGSFLRVVDGIWTAVVLPNVEDGEF